MDSSCLLDKLADLPEEDQIPKLNIFQELILKRFVYILFILLINILKHSFSIFSYGFILNACVSYDDENIYYVHISGGMLVYIISDVNNAHCRRRLMRIASSEYSDSQSSPFDCGFFWCWNFCLGKKWRTCQTGEEKYQDIMLADFRSFCANEKNRLLNFWNEANQIANTKMTENEQKSGEYGSNYSSTSENF